MQVDLQMISKSYGSFQALKPLSLKIPSGKFTTILGPSGCGKTTLLRSIAGLETPDCGDIRFNDELIFSSDNKVNRPTYKRGLGMVFQDFALWPHLTMYENVAFGLKATGNTRDLDKKVMDALDAVRLIGLEKRYPGELSGGQQQRVAFARAIAIRPQIILFDEPLSALDAVLREELRFELTRIVESYNLTAIYVTHDQDEAMSMSNELVVMNQGEILQTGTPESIYNTPNCTKVARFVGQSNWLKGQQEMFRPEHLAWEGMPFDYTWEAVVKAVSFVGDRYEVLVETAEHGSWLGYHHKRLAIGKHVSVFVSKNHIQLFEQRKEVAV